MRFHFIPFRNDGRIPTLRPESVWNRHYLREDALPSVDRVRCTPDHPMPWRTRWLPGSRSRRRQLRRPGRLTSRSTPSDSLPSPDPILANFRVMDDGKTPKVAQLRGLPSHPSAG
jgi:hypothetical protein